MKKLGMSCLLALTASFAIAQPAPGSAALAASVRLADVHRHVQRWVTPAQLDEQMRANNVGWSGAVGPPFGPWDTQPYIDLLGPRYIPTLAQMELGRIFADGGVGALENPDHPVYRELFGRAEQLFEQGKARGFGELILNNKSSNPNASFRRQARLDAPVFKRMFGIAEKYSGFVQIHTEEDADSVAQLRALAVTYPKVPIILSHCLFTPDLALVRSLLASHPNLYCELSARSRSHFPNPDLPLARARIIYSLDHADAAWLALIEEFPTRFMVGSDTYYAGINFDVQIREIRNGLLARLKPETIPLVAFENAVRVMQLK